MKFAFAKALRDARKAKGLTQEDFSDISSRTYLSSLERGKKSPTLDKINDIAKTMNIHLVSLITLACLNLESNQDKDLDKLLKDIKDEVKNLY